VVTSVPFHQERAFITMVSAATQAYPELRIYSHPGTALPWDEVVTHSQGTLTGTRAGLIAEERKRIDTYTARGDLVPRAEVLRYLRQRDATTVR